MQIEKLVNQSANNLPVIAALPYSLFYEGGAAEIGKYDPLLQITEFASKAYSTCRYEESVGGIFSKSRTDTQKDD